MTASQQQAVSNQLVSCFYAYQILKFITAEIRDNVDTQFNIDHLLAQADMIGIALDDMMDVLIE